MSMYGWVDAPKSGDPEVALETQWAVSLVTNIVVDYDSGLHFVRSLVTDTSVLQQNADLGYNLSACIVSTLTSHV